jgi:radical SAM superfamily enzyme YgiQ (UPF0313 family)
MQLRFFQKRKFHTNGVARSPQKRLLLVSLDWMRPKDPMSLAQASILTNLKKHNIEVIAKSWSVNHSDFDAKKVSDFVMQHTDGRTDVALGAYVWNEKHTQEILKTLKRNKFPGQIILGGPQVSYVKPGKQRKKLEEYYPEVDIFIRGYGEQVLAELFSLNNKNNKNPFIKGVHYAGEPDLGFSAAIDLEKLPSPFLSGRIPPQKFIRWETQRGCPFRCSFCQHRESDVTMERKQFAQTRIMQEIDWIIANPIIQDIAVLDPTFNSGPYYLSIIKALAEKRYQGKISLQCRMEMMKDEFLIAIEKLNESAQVVLEFGLQTIHKKEANIIQRPLNLPIIERMLKETMQRKIDIEVSLIFGLPGQTLQSFNESIDFCKKYQVPTIYAFPLMLLRGTPLYEQKQELGLVESDEINLEQTLSKRINNTFGIPHVIKSPTFTEEDWHKMAALAASLDDYNACQKSKMKNTLQYTVWDPETEFKLKS